MSKAFPLLLSPLQVGPKTLRNRVLITGHVPRLADNNLVGERYVAYHRARARGGAGLQITGAQGVHPSGVLGTAYSLANLDDRVIPGYRLLAEGVHGEGGTILAQLAHGAGTLNVSDVGRPLLSPSAVQSELARETPRVMSKRDIAEMIGCFERAAARVKAGGLDGVELLAAFGFLLGAFLSPLTNKRLDRYGGSEANRARFVLEVAEAVRGALGPDLILGLRIPGDELTEGGLSNADLVALSQRLTADGRINYLNVIAGTNYKRLGRMVHWGPTPTPHGLFVPLAAAIKRQVKVPVFVTGRVTDPALAEKFLAEGAADMIGMTRAHIADPEIVRKIERGDAEAIRPCVGANVCISLTGGALRCFHNPEVGRETEWPALAPASKPLQVAVIGGGPAGLEAARAAAARGHRVTLYEASNRLGGRLALWAQAPLTRELGKAVQWRIEQLKRLQVRVELGRRLKSEDLAALGADAILVATGSAPLVARKFEGVPTATPEEVLRHSPQVQGRVVVWDHGGGREALAAAEALVSAGRAVTLVTNEFTVGEGVDPVVRTVIHQHLLKGGAIFRAGEDLLRCEPGAVILRNLYSGEESRIENVALLVHWQGRVAEDALLDAARKAAPVAKLIGDALSPRGVTLAVAEGQRAARDL